jgi:hypothetical protein
VTFDGILVVAILAVESLVAIREAEDGVPQNGWTVAECVVIENEKRGGDIDAIRKVIAPDTPVAETRHERTRLEPIARFGAPTIYQAVVIRSRSTGHVYIIQKIYAK